MLNNRLVISYIDDLLANMTAFTRIFFFVSDKDLKALKCHPRIRSTVKDFK